jgi:hypothetical protein
LHPPLLIALMKFVHVKAKTIKESPSIHVPHPRSLMSHVLIAHVPNPRRIPSFGFDGFTCKLQRHDCEMHVQLYKKVSPYFKTFMKWMKTFQQIVWIWLEA